MDLIFRRPGERPLRTAHAERNLAGPAQRRTLYPCPERPSLRGARPVHLVIRTAAPRVARQGGIRVCGALSPRIWIMLRKDRSLANCAVCRSRVLTSMPQSDETFFSGSPPFSFSSSDLRLTPAQLKQDLASADIPFRTIEGLHPWPIRLSPPWQTIDTYIPWPTRLGFGLKSSPASGSEPTEDGFDPWPIRNGYRVILENNAEAPVVSPQAGDGLNPPPVKAARKVRGVILCSSEWQPYPQ